MTAPSKETFAKSRLSLMKGIYKAEKQLNALENRLARNEDVKIEDIMKVRFFLIELTNTNSGDNLLEMEDKHLSKTH